MGLWETIASATGNGRLDRLSRENGWEVDERKGNAIAHYFKGNHITPRYTVVIYHAEGSPIMSFQCACRATFSGRNLPDDLLSALLVRNDDVSFGAWFASIDAGEVSMGVRYAALAAGVDAGMFKSICQLLVEEVSKVEALLHRKGLL